MKLNLGCGIHFIKDYVNVDKFGNPDVLWDLESFPWPWNSDSIEEIVMHHSLEHLGQTSLIFMKIIQELYRILIPNGIIKITAPYPSSTIFWADPTHIRPIIPDTFAVLDQLNSPNPLLPIGYHIDFSVLNATFSTSKPYATHCPDNISNLAQFHVNGVVESYFEVVAHKPERKSR